MFSRNQVAVFVDGCFWHGCPLHRTVSRTNAQFWADKVTANRARDGETDRLLTDAAWTVIRVWEHEDPIAAAQRIAETVSSLALE